MDPVESYNDVMRFVKLMLAEKNEFCAHGATKFRKFCNSFAKFLAIFCANFAIMISTSDAKFFSPEQIYESDESFSDVTRFVQRKMAKCMQFSLRKARRNSGNFAIHSRDFPRTFARS